ncbi:MAG: LysM peptidoglycan-binding domain-containing protein [Planctomycetota bacterium]
MPGVTREQKLALVIGFAAVMLVGLLISDHLAAVRSQSLDEFSPDESVVVQPPRNETPRSRRAVAIPLIPGDGTPAAGPRPDAPDPETRAIERPAPREQTPLRETLLEQATDRLARGAESFALGARDLAANIAELDVREMARLDQAPATIRVADEPAPAESADRDADAPPEERTIDHRVAKLETLSGLARRYYGDPNAWRKIARANPGRVGDNGSVREGVTLRIPGPIQAPPPEREATAASQTYTVRSNDTLSEIAQKVLGTMRRQDEILRLNQDVIRDPDDLRPGMVLRLPST